MRKTSAAFKCHAVGVNRSVAVVPAKMNNKYLKLQTADNINGLSAVFLPFFVSGKNKC
ncbi:MAG: hypothetical protein ACFWUM_09530 [Eubacteriales bacterium]